MFFYLTTSILARFWTKEAPRMSGGEWDVQDLSAIEAWKHSDLLYRNYVINGIVDSLYNLN